MNKKEFDDLAELEKLGDTVQDIIESAVKSKNFQKLNQTITQAVDGVVRGSSAAAQGRGRTVRASERIQPDRGGNGGAAELSRKTKAQSFPPELYGTVGEARMTGILLAVFGGFITAIAGMGFFIMLILQLFISRSLLVTILLLMAGTGLGVWMICFGSGELGKARRFQTYLKTLGERTYCSFDLLAQAVNKPVKFVRKDIKSMISKGWFRQGHVDRQETCLITANETYQQYEQTQKLLEERQEAARKEEEARNKVSPEVQEVLDKGDEYLEKLRRSNDAIPGEEISAKISIMEQIVKQIFARAEAHPEVIPDLKRFMDYYLPMTMKLLDAYEEMDGQPVQGDNIRSSKKEIEDTLDTLNDAFARILDSIFQDTAWDVSSDISVLHTVLAQEGLAGNDFELK